MNISPARHLLGAGLAVRIIPASDLRLKENIRPTAKGLDDLMRIQVSDFNFKSKPGSTETGFIAQQLYTVLPEVVTQGGTDPSTDPWMVDYGRVTPLLTKAIQELKQETDSKEASLDKENSELKASVAEQDKKIAALNGANVGLKAEVAQLKASNEKLAAMAAEMEALKKTVTSIQRKENGAMRAVSLEQQ